MPRCSRPPPWHDALGQRQLGAPYLGVPIIGSDPWGKVPSGPPWWWQTPATTRNAVSRSTAGCHHMPQHPACLSTPPCFARHHHRSARHHPFSDTVALRLSCVRCVLQAAAAQQGVNWDDIVRAAEASQHAQIQPAKQGGHVRSELCTHRCFSSACRAFAPCRGSSRCVSPHASAPCGLPV